MRRTKIVCTIGPASSAPTQLAALLERGMDVARLNLSHERVETHRDTVRALRRVAADAGRELAILLDTKGAEVRIAPLEEPIAITRGEEYRFAPAGTSGAIIPVLYDGFVADAAEATHVIVDNGTLRFRITGIDRDTVRAVAEDDGTITSKRHVNLPGAFIHLPALTPEDWDAVDMACAEDVDFLALSFIRTAEEVEEVRARIQAKNGQVRLIAKIETRHAIDNLAAILEASDGLMVARGDLGTEVPFEEVPALQDAIVHACRAAGKPVIVATHMLESMIAHPLPTRAEVTDIAHAVTSGADATMLSGETASGKYPLRALEVMARVLEATEARMTTAEPAPADDVQGNVATANAAAAVTIASILHAKAIIVLTETGNTATAVSAARPQCPIVACTTDVRVQRALRLAAGVEPLRMSMKGYTEEVLDAAVHAACAAKILQPGDQYVLVSGVLQRESPISAVQARVVEQHHA